jgi:murein DD-endopeptidase MepM/ murein hydrolase activator NlpD
MQLPIPNIELRMKKFFEKIRFFLAALGKKIKRKPKDVSAVHDPSTKPRAQGAKRKQDRFAAFSWIVTILIVIALLGSTILYKNSRPTTYVTVPQPTSAPGANLVQPGAPIAGSNGGGVLFIARKLQLKTNIPDRPRYKPTLYRVSRGDAMLSIAGEYKLTSESILFANPQMEDNPHNLKPGMELQIPPVDGLYYEWKDGDTFETVAEKFDAKADDIIAFPGNNIDLTDPKVESGATIMIPGGTRELRNWAADLQTAGRGVGTGTGGGSASNSCGGGPVASGYGWPADDHTLSGNPYGPSHLGIDISAPEGSNVYAAGAGVVTMAQGGWNYGYGNVIQIDHGNGDVTVYAHLSSINVSMCQAVGQGALIGLSGNTGNSFGAHLHFEIRRGGSNINPYDIVQ